MTTSASQDEAMTSLCTPQKLHDLLITKQCLCKYREQDILDQVYLERAPGFQATSLGSEVNKSLQFSSRRKDDILSKVSFIANIMEVEGYCRRVCEVQEALVKDEKLLDMWALVSFPDQLVAFCAMKCSKALLLQLARANRPCVKNFLSHALHSVLQTEGQTNTQSDVYRHIFTFDLCCDLLQLTGDCQCSSSGHLLPCVTSVNMNSSHASQTLQTESIAEMCCCTIREGILGLYDMLGAFFSASASRNPAESPAENFLTWLLSVEPRSVQTICFAYMRLLHVFTKYVCGKYNDDQICSYVSWLLQPLCGILKSGGCRDVAFVKMLLSTAITCVDACVRKLVPGYHMQEDHAQTGSTPTKLSTVIVGVISAILEPACLKSLPYFDGRVGFGGTQFADDARIPKDLEEYCKGDRTLLRRLATFIILCVEYASHLVPDYCQESAHHLLQLSAFIRAKLKAASKTCGDNEDHDNWIFFLFGDQDDALIATMHSLLKIHCHRVKVVQAAAMQMCDAQQQTRGCSHRRQNTQDTVIGSHEDVSNLHPHQIFLFFLDHVTLDHSILLDLVISTETEFLEYFVRFLRYMSSDWQGFKAFHARKRKISEDSCNDLSNNGLDSCKQKEEEEGEEDDEDGGKEKEEVETEEEIPEEEGHVHTLGEHISSEDRCSRDFCSSSKTPSKGRGDFCDKTVPKAVDRVTSQGCDSDSSAEEHDMYGGLAKRQKVDEHVTDPMQETQWMRSHKETLKEQRVSENSHEECGVHATPTPNFQNSQQQDSFNGNFDCSSSYSHEDGPSTYSTLYSLDDTMTVLIRLRLAVERLDSKGLFPFSAKPLVRLLVTVEDLHECESA